jgi:hypothetical protein
MPPFSFSDDELEQLMVLATPLPPQNRNRFLEAIADRDGSYRTNFVLCGVAALTKLPL